MTLFLQIVLIADGLLIHVIHGFTVAKISKIRKEVFNCF